MNRKTSLLFVLVIILFIGTACSKSVDKKKQPNIIFILADDMGYSDLGCYGSELIQTPNIDRLASEGMKFTHHYAGNSVCAPSRCSLMTGLHTGHCQVRGNIQWKPYGQIQLKEETNTVATLLKNAGYKTAIIGKWGLGVEGTSGDPLKQGFDYSYGYLCQVLAHNHCPEYLIENGKKVYLDNEVIYTDKSHWTEGLGSYPVKRKQFSQDLFTEKTIDFIERNQEDPFFIYLSVIIPHDNGEALEGKRYSDIPSFKPYENKDWTESEKGYAAMITHLDKDVGTIISKLKELGLDNNTLVIFTSDNGGDSPDKFYSLSNLPFRGHKRDLYEGGIREPMIAWWPSSIHPGTTSNHVSAFWDFMPTVCDLAGIEAPSNIDGISYLPELLGKQQPKHETLYFEFHEQGGKQAIIEGDWKCLRLNTKTPANMVVELYNIANDKAEENNLADVYPDKVKHLIALMEEQRTQNEYFNLYSK